MISSDVCFRDISLLALQRKSRGGKKDGLRVLECIFHCHGLAKVIISQDERNRKFQNFTGGVIEAYGEARFEGGED